MSEFCAICLEHVEKINQLVNCGHKFCDECLQQQLKNNWPNLPRCSLCRRYWNIQEVIEIYHRIPNWKVQDIRGHRKTGLTFRLEYKVERSDNYTNWEPASVLSIVESGIIARYEARLRAYRKYYQDRLSSQNWFDEKMRTWIFLWLSNKIHYLRVHLSVMNLDEIWQDDKIKLSFITVRGFFWNFLYLFYVLSQTMYLILIHVVM